METGGRRGAKHEINGNYKLLFMIDLYLLL